MDDDVIFSPSNYFDVRGQGISPHVDTHSAFEDGLASLSLGSGESHQAWPLSSSLTMMHPPAHDVVSSASFPCLSSS